MAIPFRTYLEKKHKTAGGGTDYWVVKLNALGKIQWDRTIGGNATEVLPWIQQTSDDGYILGGWSYSDISGEKTQNSRGIEDFWVVKLNSEGNVQWDRTIGGSRGDGINSLQQTKDGGYILGGYSSSNKSGEKTENSRGGDDYWVVKLDRLGNIQWDKTIGGNNTDVLYTLQQTRDDGYILGGYSSSNKSGEKSQNSRGKTDYWIVKLDESGNIQWDETIGGNNSDILNSLAQTTDNGYILGGQSSSNSSGEKTEVSRGADDYWVVKIDRLGKIQWDKTIGGESTDVLYSIREIATNEYELGGFSSSGISGDKTEKLRGGKDYWVVTLGYKKRQGLSGITSAMDNIIAPYSNFSFYPNPVKDILHIAIKDKATFYLTDQSGKVLLTKNITGDGELDVASLPAGLYYLKNNTTDEVQKVIVLK